MVFQTKHKDMKHFIQRTIQSLLHVFCVLLVGILFSRISKITHTEISSVTQSQRQKCSPPWQYTMCSTEGWMRLWYLYWHMHIHTHIRTQHTHTTHTHNTQPTHTTHNTQHTTHNTQHTHTTRMHNTHNNTTYN